MRKWLIFYPSLPFFMAATFLVTVAGCNNGLPSLVESANGQTWIPIADTAFLIPDKTWLKGYGHRKSDGLIAHISLHAMAPDAQPWSEEVQDLMYPKVGGWGRRIVISVKEIDPDSKFSGRFQSFPQSLWGGGRLVEESSDLEAHGWHKFREETGKAGKINTGRIFYEYLENGVVKYFSSCSNSQGKPGHTSSCRLIFPYANKLRVTMVFQRLYMPEGAVMAGVIENELAEFEAAGQSILAAKLKDNKHDLKEIISK